MHFIAKRVWLRDKKGVKNVVTYLFSGLEHVSNECVDNKTDVWFPNEQLFVMKNCLCYANHANFLFKDTPPQNLSFYQRNKFFSEVKYYLWEKPFLFNKELIHRYYIQKTHIKCIIPPTPPNFAVVSSISFGSISSSTSST